IGAPDRPGIVHRLDKDTTGSLVVAKNDDAHRDLARQFKAHSTRRRYIALVWGAPSGDEGTIDLAIGRDPSDRKKISTRARRKRRAVTRFRVLRRYPHLTLVELRPETGRTHQLRVHLASTGHPVACDPVYCKRRIPPAMDKSVADMLKSIKHQLLHAAVLGFTHPATGEPVEFTAGTPPDMQRLIDLLEERCSSNERG
ncbi:MAG: RluA family pseudouridine synthase, partial [Thermodesulfobacteriota bacterium]